MADQLLPREEPREPQPGDFEVLPCGCTVELLMEDGRKVLQYVPCKSTCPFYLATLALSNAAGKPVEHRHDLP